MTSRGPFQPKTFYDFYDFYDCVWECFGEGDFLLLLVGWGFFQSGS